MGCAGAGLEQGCAQVRRDSLVSIGDDITESCIVVTELKSVLGHGLRLKGCAYVCVVVVVNTKQ